MKLAAFRLADDAPDVRRVGLVVGDGRLWWVHAFPDGTDLVGLLAVDRDVREEAADLAAQSDGLRPEDVVLLPPVYPTAMRDFLAFEAHVDGMERGHGNPGVPEDWFTRPVFLFMAPHAVTGAFDDVAMPPETERLDFELEIAAVICRDVRNASPDEAHAAIGGYCVMNDWSARDVQGREMALKLGPSKGKDFATTIGPWVVTGHMGWSFEQLVSHASRASWVKAGEVLASGTCSSGSLAESWGRTGTLTPPPLQVGDVVDMTIEGIGTIRNTVVADTEDVPPAPAARRRSVGAAR
jgi:2-keto-4-pentenoate hydratase/2-oxohepta-3-ene-1,7-dioic acid hydratase in catechol pathway